jgi:hypothetical protein
MSELVLYKNIMLLGKGIDTCIEKKLIGPALILLYSGIDTAGWLDSSEEYATRTSFINWVDVYLLKAKPLQCTSIDLYAERCGLLHTFTPDSKLSSSGNARRIYYAWGTANVQDLQWSIDIAKKSRKYVAVHIDDLYEAWRLGILQFAEELERDPIRKSRVSSKASKFFSEMGMKDLTNVLTKLDKDTGA